MRKMAAVDPYKQFETPPDTRYVRSFMQEVSSVEGKCTDVFDKGKTLCPEFVCLIKNAFRSSG